MLDTKQVTLIDLVGALSRALDMVSSVLAQHHAHVGRLSLRIAETLNLPHAECRNALITGLLHDAGALSLHSSVDSLVFENDRYTHAKAGGLLLAPCSFLPEVSSYVRHHHDSWDALPSAELAVANIICLADYIDVRLKRKMHYSEQFSSLIPQIREHSGSLFSPEFADAAISLLEQPSTEDILNDDNTSADYSKYADATLDIDEITQFANIFASIIDFRSQFTATHSHGVAATARQLASWMGYDDGACKIIYLAGLLHDVGKLAVPKHILEKPDKLTSEEFSIMQNHARLSEEILSSIPGLEIVSDWASQHHERVNGAGYPHGRFEAELSFGARILQVADVFTAIAEDRPYRSGMDPDSARMVLSEQAACHALDKFVVSTLLERYEEINDLRQQVQRQAREGYDAFYTALHSETS